MKYQEVESQISPKLSMRRVRMMSHLELQWLSLGWLLMAMIHQGSGSSWLQNGSSAAIIEHRNGPLHSVFPRSPAQVSSVQDLFEFICSGPLLDKIGLTQEKVAESIDKWLLYGRQLNELYLTKPQKARIYHYYISVFLWCENEIAQHQSKFKDEQDAQHTEAELKEAHDKVLSLEVELENKDHCCEELKAGCLELQLQLESMSKECSNHGINQKDKPL